MLSLFGLVRIVFATLLVCVVPGYFLAAALWPRRASATSPGPIGRALLVVVLSVSVTMLVGVTLGFLPHGERGFLQTSATGFPYAELSLLALSALFGFVAFKRGAWERVPHGQPVGGP